MGALGQMPKFSAKIPLLLSRDRLVVFCLLTVFCEDGGDGMRRDVNVAGTPKPCLHELGEWTVSVDADLLPSGTPKCLNCVEGDDLRGMVPCTPVRPAWYFAEDRCHLRNFSMEGFDHAGTIVADSRHPSQALVKQ